jgi:hypothetical protein
MSLQSLEFLESNSKYTKRNKKDKSNKNSVTKRQSVKMILFTYSLSFLFPLVYFEFGFGNNGDLKTYFMNIYKFVPTFFAI